MSSTRPNRIRPRNDQELDLNTLRELVGVAPNFPSSWIRLATVLEAAGLTSEALDAWTRAGLLVPNSEVVANALSRLGKMTPSKESGPGKPLFEDPSLQSPGEQKPDPREAPRPETEREHLDIDALITDLQSGRRQPTVDHPDVDEPSDLTEGADLVVSETLARIYEAQNHLDEAVKIYDTLADQEKDAEKADVLRARAADLQRRISKSG